MFYLLLKLLIKTALKVFFREMNHAQKSDLPTHSTIVVANHPNTFMDPFIVGSIFKQPLYFLAKGALFKSAFNRWFLGQMNMIPIFRAQDNQELESSPEQMRERNEAAFKQCFDFMKKQGSLLIFPEGTSVAERRLRQIKSGAARIALGAEASADFSLNLQIQAVGLNYTNSQRFRSRVFASCAAPILVKDYQALYLRSPQEAIKKLTHDIEEALKGEMIIIETDEDDLLIKRIEQIFKANFATEAQKSMGLQNFEMTQEIVKAYHYFKGTEPERVWQLAQHIQRYFSTLNRLALKDSALADSQERNNLWLDSLKSLFFLLLGFPLYLFGLMNNYPAYILPSKIAHWLTKEKEYVAPIMMSSGIFTFSICYALQISGFHWLFQNGLYTAIYALLLPLSAFWALRYTARWQGIRKKVTLLSLFYSKNTLITELLALRSQIIAELQRASADYERVNESIQQP